MVYGFLDEVVHRRFGAEFSSFPRMRRPDLENLLTDDLHRRVGQARLAAVEWVNSEISDDDTAIISERLMITPRGLLYAAELSGRSQPYVYYLATSPELFEPIIDYVETSELPQGAAAAVDRRYGHDLEFPWPLDSGLRRLLDAHAVLRFGPDASSSF